MSLETLASKYIEVTERVLKEVQETKGAKKISGEQVNCVLNYVKNYLEDAKYFRTRKMFETSLTSVAYCEGLLDALRLLGTVKFEWPTEKKREK